MVNQIIELEKRIFFINTIIYRDLKLKEFLLQMNYNRQKANHSTCMDSAALFPTDDTCISWHILKRFNH